MYALFALGALATSALAQSAITFSNTTFTAPVKVGSKWPISFTLGNGEPVAIGFGNSTYAFQVVDGLTAPGTFDWDVAVPVNVVEGLYQLALVQGDSDPVFSPTFSLVIPPEDISSTTDAPTTTLPFPDTGTTTTTTVTAIYLPYPANATHVTYIYYEESCGCHQTTTCAASDVPASTSSTTVTYSAAECGCTTTVEAPCAETVIPLAPAPAPATNTPVAPSAAPVEPEATTADNAEAAPNATQTGSLPSFTGGAEKLAGSSLGLVAALAALVVV